MSAGGGQEPVCQICMSAGPHRTFAAREMMFGTRDEFKYFECPDCGCLQIEGPPADLDKYYPPAYHSPPDLKAESAAGRRERFVVGRVSSYRLRGKGLLGRVLESRHPTITDLPQWLKKRELGLRLSSRILDVGCGAGHLLLELQRLGFSNLTGVDLFIDSDISYGKGLSILKGSLAELDGGFDLIMLHHSFEHIPDQHAVMAKLYGLVKPGRYVLVRIPLAGSYAWREYGTDWVQLDAPRHFFLHTERSFRALASGAGFRVADVVYDSSAFQFAGSEQYRRNIPLFDQRSYIVNPDASIFSAEQLDCFEKRAAELNKERDGDQACFYLHKPRAGAA